jgi:hypothetical protein
LSDLRHNLLGLTDEELLRQCEVETFRGSGPGGQKRNKTESAVRIRHRPTGLTGQSDDSRSQHENRRSALLRLRQRLALELRNPVALPTFEIPAPLRQLIAAKCGMGQRHVSYLPAIAALLDLFVCLHCSMRDTAARLGLSTGGLSRLITADDKLWVKVNTLRAEQQLKPLR